MGGRITIPVRIVRPQDDRAAVEHPERLGAARASGDGRPVVADLPDQRQPGARVFSAYAEAAAPAVEASSASQSIPDTGSLNELEPWRDRALRLQADMENYRKRQQRQAQDQIDTERRRLLLAFIGVVDDLERALAAADGDLNSLRQGVQITCQTALRLLSSEGVERLEAERRPFDPAWHEAVATVGGAGSSLTPDTVAEVLEAGYRLGDRLLRPARVVVAV